MTKPFFSIIIPALNEEKYLPHLLSDLAAQSYRDFEVIVADGESTDKTVALAKSLKKSLPSLKIVTSSKRHVCVQRNLGAKSADADWLIFMDADNRLPPYFLQGIKYRLEMSPCDLATCYIQSDQNTAKDKNIALAINYAMEILKNSSSYQVLESMVIIKKTCFEQIGGFDEHTNYGEGTVLGKMAKSLHYRYALFKDPLYTFSFRRIRKYGVLNLTSIVAQHEITHLLNLPATDLGKKYPMRGGAFFDVPLARRKRFTKRIQKFFRQLQNPQTLKQTLTKLLEE